MQYSARRLELRPSARADLAEIFRYSVDVFGIDRARRYIDAINEMMFKLVRGEQKSVEAVKRGLRKVKVGSHYLYFRPKRDVIVIVRVLHQAMDAPRHLRGR